MIPMDTGRSLVLFTRPWFRLSHDPISQSVESSSDLHNRQPKNLPRMISTAIEEAERRLVAALRGSKIAGHKPMSDLSKKWVRRVGKGALAPCPPSIRNMMP
jgi:hypothetical protein